MKFIHVADLHIGKKINDFDMLPDQRVALEGVLKAARALKPDAVFIAGDVYDRAVPPAEAVTLLSDFLTGLLATGAQVLLIAGNHDSPERLDFGGQILEKQGLVMAGAYRGRMRRARVSDAWGAVDVWLMPFFRPREVGADSYDQAAREAIAREEIDFSRRNVLLCHQFVTCAGEAVERSESELALGAIGGVDNVDVSAFEGFQYVALGHLHGPQRIGRDSARYAGSPVKYSFSEWRQKKTFVVGEMDGEGRVSWALEPYPRLHDMREIRGELERLIAPDVVAAADPNDYLHVTLTDEVLPVAPRERLADHYPNLMKLDIERPAAQGEDFTSEPNASPYARFEAFFRQMNGIQMNERQARYAKGVFERVWEEAE